MHIPDGYLSPKTCVLFYAGMAPVWYLASRKASMSLKVRQLPMLALGAAFTFLIMMFNIPIPGGSSGHMVGTVVVSIVLGPWAGVVALSIALALQAFLFADGGVLALGANCFNMAFLMSFTGYYIYRALTIGKSGHVRRFAASAVAGYIALNIAAFAVALELGVQPAIAGTAAGIPLYAPYPLPVTIPAMMLPHMLFFGPVEALGTALVVSYAVRSNEDILYNPERVRLKPLWIIIAVMIILTPIGLIASGTPWGEWGKDEVLKIAGFIPSGMDRFGDIWRGVLPDYGMPGVENRFASAVFYVLSAAVGSGAVVFAIYL
ncbi:MAG: cobalt transporter CbiM, partial [Deltaproteobacteria bacterium]|nr:cobalt transporter CbiM [Deltaproteobacteria bacterium]